MSRAKRADFWGAADNILQLLDIGRPRYGSCAKNDISSPVPHCLTSSVLVVLDIGQIDRDFDIHAVLRNRSRRMRRKAGRHGLALGRIVKGNVEHGLS